MQVNIEKAFPVAAPGASSWQILSDVETVASCMPGAEITEQLDDCRYKGRVKAKVGPASMIFNGEIEVLGVDPETRELRLTSKGQDTKGTSSAQMDLTARVLDGDSGASELKGDALVTVNGKLASLGGRMMTQVADQILNQFGKSFAAKAAALAEESGRADSATNSDADSGVQAEAPKVTPEEPQAINGLAFGWSVFVGFIKSLFGKK